jgi:iron complex outermembrane recepter protein
MIFSMRNTLRSIFIATTAFASVSFLGAAEAQTAQTAADASSSNSETIETVIVTAEKTTRSAVQISGVETQKILPGLSPLKAIETLPGVVYETADPWGNNEQNEALVVHGFTTQQLGYTMDGVPLGDQQYGNYNGLSPSRAVTSENVSRVELSSGTGSLGVASTSNLGGAIETFSSDPSQEFGVDLRETGGSYDTSRTFLRLDSGDLGDGNAAYVSYLHQNARAWDFDGYQRGDQVNLKFVHDDTHGKLTFFADWNTKVEPNEDAVSYGNQQTSTSTYFPYTRPFLYPNYAAGLSYLTDGTPPAALGNNFSNYDSAAQREDVLTYAQYDWNVDNDITWSNQVYYHNDAGRGIVAGPINQAGLPGLFAIYYPSLVVGSTTSAQTLQNISNVFGGTGYEVRTTEYRDNRAGLRSTFDWQLGDQQIEAGIWYEHNVSSQERRWYPFSAANDDLTPYDIPRNPNFTQYYMAFQTDDVQLHVQDQWRILPDLLLQAGVKASLQTADGQTLIQQLNLPTTNPQVNYPSGSITSNNWFLPQVGALWDITENDQLFFNIQKNLRQYIPYGAGSNFFGTSPWSLASQQAFDTFKQTAHPETSWTYEVGMRTQRAVDMGPITEIEGQINYYHVNFSNRLFNVATYNFINPNPAILVNVGGVTMDGADLAATLHFGEHFELYDALSYNKSTYDSNVLASSTIATTLLIAGKNVPLVPSLLEKFVASANYGPLEAQINGDFVGRRYVTYLNDLSVPSTFILGLEASYVFNLPENDFVHGLKLSGNITNLADVKGISTAVVTSASGGYQAYPIAPRMFFLTLSANY